MTKKGTDRLIGLFMTVFGISSLLFMPYMVKMSKDTSVLGSDYFPRILSIVLIVLGGLLFFKTFIPSRQKENPESRGEQIPQKESDVNVWRGMLVYLIIIAYVFLIEIVGFVIISIVLMSLVMWLLNARKWYYYLILLISIFVIRLIFQNVMGVILP